MFEICTGDPLECREDCLVIGLQQVPKKFDGLLEKLDNRFDGELTELVKSGDLSAHAGSLSVIHTLGKLPVKRLLFIGLGNPKEIRKEHLKRMFGKAVKHILKMRWATAAVFLDTFCAGTINGEEAAQLLGEAAPMAAYQFAGYKRQPNIPEVQLEKVAVYIRAAGKKPEPVENVTNVHSRVAGKAETQLENADHVSGPGRPENVEHVSTNGKAGAQPIQNANPHWGAAGKAEGRLRNAEQASAAGKTEGRLGNAKHVNAPRKAKGRPGNAEHVNVAGEAEIRPENIGHAGAAGKAKGRPVKNASLQTGTYRNTDLPGETVGTALHRGYVFGKGVNTARTLVNTPVNIWTPVRLAEYAASLAEKYAFEVEILKKTEMEKLGMGAILAAAGESKEPPNMIVLRYAGEREWGNVLALVGTGAVIDGCTPGANVGMAGAAAILGAMEVVGERKPAKNVVAVLPVTGNRINGTTGGVPANDGQGKMPVETGTVITSMNGKTIEVRDTGASGLLMLADAVTYAKQYGANQIVDVATLTMDVVSALGRDKTGAVANCDAFFERVLESAKEAGEFIWRFPVTEADIENVRSSKIADLNGWPGSEGRVIENGAFIGAFAEDTPWVHLEMSGTALTGKETDLGPAGATGVMVRTLAVLAEKMAEQD
ncbi:M17 family peptidase N-terminal domain-containing protein [Heyndrickxia faecalis]|uniref:M17 family peptidase N-terminal domain-containing protein n=1 Tax=Heyndrickxia TaxID=2837504 RepID=UPI002E1E5E8C|nr:M17 family peptidase N-terminal domain-containing protein [Weizmannia sp. CD-2023]MED4838868.1 M17 family peptidase N-terminal domain-containing protein [Weizmannia sp. CD-2023]MED4867543.1 M17 family peptidase N-terminal domain-containing protein [Weizmannia sp. CD-2023]MED4900583.1 M17 family peptidase N-terminal domain-containing protein [Weizmannia sp. CD-2023]